MGIYMPLKPCGCEIESYFGYDVPSTYFPCVTHGGNPIAVAGRQARRLDQPIHTLTRNNKKRTHLNQRVCVSRSLQRHGA